MTNKQLDAFLAVKERDVDFMLLEEFVANRDFAKWFYRQVSYSDPGVDIIECEARHSVGGGGIGMGETDLWVKLNTCTPDGKRRVSLLLIENKISASFTPDQEIRYKLRLDSERNKAGADNGFTVLVAPSDYLNKSSRTLFDAALSYEELREYLKRSSQKMADDEISRRLDFRAAMLEHAIMGYRRSGGKGVIYSGSNTDFFNSLYALIESELGSSLIPMPNKARGVSSDGINFVFQGQSSLLDACKDKKCLLGLSLRFRQGEIALRFHNWPSYLPQLLTRLNSVKPSQYVLNLLPSGKTLDVIEPRLPKINTAAEFESQIENIIHNLRHVEKMKQWIEGNADQLVTWLHAFNKSRCLDK